MTEDLLIRAKNAQKNIQDISKVLDSIERIRLLNEQGRTNYKPFLRFLNMFARKDGKEVKEAAVLLFDGISYHGTELLVDERLLNCLKEHYRERLKEAKAEFDAI